MSQPPAFEVQTGKHQLLHLIADDHFLVRVGVDHANAIILSRGATLRPCVRLLPDSSDRIREVFAFMGLEVVELNISEARGDVLIYVEEFLHNKLGLKLTGAVVCHPIPVLNFLFRQLFLNNFE